MPFKKHLSWEYKHKFEVFTTHVVPSLLFILSNYSERLFEMKSDKKIQSHKW